MESVVIDLIAQAGIAVFGISAILLVAKKNKWGFVLGLASQPFWFLTSFLHQQWGIILLSVIYTATWLYGVYNWFHKGKEKK